VKLLALLLAAAAPFASVSFHAPVELARAGACDGDTAASSWMVPELWCQPRRSLWAPTDWRVWAAEWRPFRVIAAPEIPPGSFGTITIPDTLPIGTVWVQFRNAAGSSCPSNYVASQPLGR
jgi:hypothetical protein